VVSRQYPALVPLASDEGFALRGERIEFLLEPFLGGFGLILKRCGRKARRLCRGSNPLCSSGESIANPTSSPF
jgi:hypothetical protein